MLAFDKKVRNPKTNQWAAAADAFSGDTLAFRLTYASAADIDAKAMSDPRFPAARHDLCRGQRGACGERRLYGWAGLRRCAASADDGHARRAAIPRMALVQRHRRGRLAGGHPGQGRANANLQPGWLVARLGKLSTEAAWRAPTSLRATANTNYKAPKLVLDKTVSPSTNLKAGDVVAYSESKSPTRAWPRRTILSFPTRCRFR